MLPELTSLQRYDGILKLGFSQYTPSLEKQIEEFKGIGQQLSYPPEKIQGDLEKATFLYKQNKYRDACFYLPYSDSRADQVREIEKLGRELGYDNAKIAEDLRKAVEDSNSRPSNIPFSGPFFANGMRCLIT